MNILHACPANVATGGTESIHNFIRTLDDIKGVDARIYYMGGAGQPCPHEYLEYGCRYVTDLPADYRGMIIFPEIWANMALDQRYKGCIRAVNWLGIDSYHWHTRADERGAFMSDKDIIHLVQSDYAEDFMEKLGITNVYRNVDVLNRAFYKDYEEDQRNNVVLYNPAKATAFTEQLIRECGGIQFRPIRGLSRDQVIDLMRHSKLYIDFGNFPGRERIPREAVMCGCCIIIGNVGSGRYSGDFTIPTQYKYERNDAHTFAIRRMIGEVLADYDGHREDFDLFRDILRDDRELLKRQCRELVYEVQHNHTGA